jgi:hypothetical protein
VAGGWHENSYRRITPKKYGAETDGCLKLGE